MKIQFSRIITLTALTILLVVPVFVFTASYSYAAQNIVDGDLVTVSPNPDIYIVKIIGVKKFKRLILNPDIFNSYGHLKWSNVKTIDQATLDLYKLSELVIEINPDGSVADPKVYRVVSSENSDVGERSWLNLTASEFEAAGYDWDSLYKVNHKEALPSFYPTKTPLTYQDVIKIKQVPSLSSPTAFSIATSYIDGDFNGWDGETLYKLDNGEFWQQSEYSYDYDYDYHPKVLVYPSDGGYKMHIYDYNGDDVSVQQIFNVIESKIDGDFNGWEGETIYVLTNGQVWQQSSYHYHYHYAYRPDILIYPSGGGYKMHVNGDSDQDISVRRIK